MIYFTSVSSKKNYIYTNSQILYKQTVSNSDTSAWKADVANYLI